MNLALFDFDGTISARDSYLLFTRSLGQKRFFIGCLALFPWIIGYFSGIYPNSAMKEDFLHHFYKNRAWADLRLLAERFCAETVPAILRPQAMDRLHWHQHRGDAIAVVSATPRLILEPWCRNLGVDIIATELETSAEGRITGKIDGDNCWGEEKARRIRSRYDLLAYGEVFAYGDSSGDLPMLELAPMRNRYYKPFR